MATNAQAPKQAATPDQIRIVNHTLHEITLPPIHRQRTDADGKGVVDVAGRPVMDIEFPELRLPPGGWDVPGPYLSRLLSSDRPGHKRMRTLYFERGEADMPKIEVSAEQQARVGSRQGPTPPKTLAEYEEPAALVFIAEEDDVAALKRWSNDKRRAVAKAAKDRLLQLGGGR